jgi:hypothetical protein
MPDIPEDRTAQPSEADEDLELDDTEADQVTGGVGGRGAKKAGGGGSGGL